MNPQETLYVNELSRKLDLDKRNLVKKIKELEKEGILKSQSRGNLKLYSINKNYALYKEYRQIILKTLGFEHKLRKIIEGTKGVKEAYIYGSYAENKMDVHSDIDLLVVGSHSIVLLQRHLSRLQKDVDREIHAVNMDEREFRKRIKAKDTFVSNVLKKKHIKISK
jgi:predicted nucleotidyltransferase